MGSTRSARKSRMMRRPASGLCAFVRRASCRSRRSPTAGHAARPNSPQAVLPFHRADEAHAVGLKPPKDCAASRHAATCAHSSRVPRGSACRSRAVRSRRGRSPRRSPSWRGGRRLPRHHQEVGLARQFDMAHLDFVGEREQVLMDLVAAEARERERRHELLSGARQDAANGRLRLRKVRNELERLVGRNSAPDDQETRLSSLFGPPRQRSSIGSAHSPAPRLRACQGASVGAEIPGLGSQAAAPVQGTTSTPTSISCSPSRAGCRGSARYRHNRGRSRERHARSRPPCRSSDRSRSSLPRGRTRATPRHGSHPRLRGAPCRRPEWCGCSR